jgi:methionyl-tRNA synthetase
VPESRVLGPVDILFNKIEDRTIQQEEEKLKRVEAKLPDAAGSGADTIEFDTFKKVVLKSAKVLAAEKMPGADKLLKLQIDLGAEKRQIVAGIATSYTPEQVVGKTVLVVANLKPAVIRGVESQGMLLAVQSDKGYSLVTTDGEVPSGIRAE